MEEKKKRRRTPQNYKHHAGAFCLSVYDPRGQAIPASVRREAEEAILKIALENNLLIGIATT